MNRLIACMIGGAVHQTFGGNATTAHIISTDLSQIYVAATWVGTVELAIVAAVGLGLWLRGHKVRPAHVKLRAGDQHFVKLRAGSGSGVYGRGR